MKFKKFLNESINESVKIGKVDIVDLIKKNKLKSTSWQSNRESKFSYSDGMNGDVYFGYENTKADVLRAGNTDFGLQIISDDAKKMKITLYKITSTDLLLIGSKEMTLKKFFTEFKGIFSKPLSIAGVALNKFSHFELNGKNLIFVMADGNKKIYVNLYYGLDDIKSKTDIDKKIDDLTKQNNIKIPKAEIKKLEVILPALYGKINFELSSKIMPEVAKFSKDKYFQKFIKNQNNESRTGWGIKFYSDKIIVHGMIGNISSGYESKRFDFKKNKPTSLNTLKKFMEREGVIDYIIQLSQSMFDEADKYLNYMKNGGAID